MTDGSAAQGNWWVFMLTFLLTLTIGVVVSLQTAAPHANADLRQDNACRITLLHTFVEVMK